MSGSLSSWRARLRPASWRGVPFQVWGGERIYGRRIHVHEYPFKDDPWPEDLGRRTRSIAVKGFLIGDDVDAQETSFAEAAEQKGPGELIHPTRGTLTVTLIGLAVSDAWDEGRVVRLAMEFIESGERRFPASIIDGRAEVGGAADLLDKVAGEGGEKAILVTLQQGYGGAQSIVRTAQGYVSTARGLVNSATSAVRSVTALAGLAGLGNLGRFAAGSGLVNGVLGRVTSLTSGVNSALSRVNSARNAVTRLGSTVMDLAGRL